MQSSKKELPILNFIWVGPPRTTLALLTEGKLQSDIQDVIHAAQCCNNPVRFFCLKNYRKNYESILKNIKNVKVMDIESYIEKIKKHSDNDIQQYAKSLLLIKNEILQKPRDRIIDRASFKDAFTLFFLACEGGYVLDANIKLGTSEKLTNKFTYPAYETIKFPYCGPSPECWALYVPPHQTNLSKRMIKEYLSNWDKVQNIIRGKNLEDISSILNIIKFHANIMDLNIGSIEIVLLENEIKNDPDWRFDMIAKQNGVSAKCRGITIEKTYSNSHKPEIECKNILLKKIDEQSEKKKIINDYRESFVKKFKEIIQTGTLDIFNDYSRIISLYSALLELDEIFEQSERNEQKTSEKETREKNNPYAALQDNLRGLSTISPQEIVNQAKNSVKEVLLQALEEKEFTGEKQGLGGLASLAENQSTTFYTHKVKELNEKESKKQDKEKVTEKDKNRDKEQEKENKDEKLISRKSKK